jgi:hypothetical protein
MSIFTETFPNFVSASLADRQDRLVNPDRRIDLVKYQSSRNSFIRMTSGVEVDGRPDLAKKYVLQGGTLNDGKPRVGVGDNGAYSSKTPGGVNNLRGLRPMPGINSMTAECKTAYGSLFEATVRFTCWDIKQLEELELLFMRPGYTVLLEWGWAYDKQQPKFYDILNIKGPLDFQQAYKDLFKKCEENKGDYEALLGTIKNYQWSARPDGGYDCTTYIIALGEVLESLKINYAPLNINFNGGDSTGLLKTYKPNPTSIAYPHRSNSFDKMKDYYSKGILSGLLYEIQEFMQAKSFPDAKDLLGKPYPDIYIPNFKGDYEPYSVFLKKWNFKNVSTTLPPPTSAVGDTYNYYITLESLCKLVNERVIFKNIDSQEGKTLVEISTHNRTYSGAPSVSLECIAHPLQISTDPTRCLIKADSWINQKITAISSTPKPDVTAFPISNTVKDFISQARIFNNPYYNLLKAIDDKALAYSNVDINIFKNILQDIRKEIVYSIQKAETSYYLIPNKSIPYDKCGGLVEGVLGFNILKFIESDPQELYNKFLELIILNEKIYQENLKTNIEKSTDNKVVMRNVEFSNKLRKFFLQAIGNDLKVEILAGRQLIPENKNSIITVLNDELKFHPLNDNGNKWGAWLYDDYSQQAITTASKNATEALTDLKSLKPYFTNDIYTRGNISNIYIDIDYLHFLLTNSGLEYRDASGKHIVNLVDFFKSICQTIQECTGNINDFSIHIDPRDSKGRIVDLNITSDKTENELFQIELHNTKSTARSYKLESRIFPEQGTIIAISAQADQQSGQLGYNNSTLTSYNRGIKDRLKPRLIVEQSEVEQNKLESVLVSSFARLNKYFSILNSNNSSDGIFTRGAFAEYGVSRGTVSEEKNIKYNSADYQNALRDIFGYFNALPQDQQAFNGIIPVVLSMDIDGIGGIVIGNLFKINEEILPLGYKIENLGRKLGFLVKSFSHKVENNDWITIIEAYPYLIPTPDFKQSVSPVYWNIYLGAVDVGLISQQDQLTSPAQQQQTATNVDKIIRFFLDQGFSNEAVAGIIGNWQQESYNQLKQDLINYDKTKVFNDSTQTYAAGIAQWVGDRRVNLLKQAKSQGVNIVGYDDAIKIKNNATKTPNSLTILKQAFVDIPIEIQLNFALKEMKSIGSFTGFKVSTDIRYTTDWIHSKYEGNPDASNPTAYNKRFINANEILKYILSEKYKLSVPLTTNLNLFNK